MTGPHNHNRKSIKKFCIQVESEKKYVNDSMHI